MIITKDLQAISKDCTSVRYECLTFPFYLNQCIQAKPCETLCPVRYTTFEIDDRVECVFADTNNIKLPVNGIICGSCVDLSKVLIEKVAFIAG